MKRGSPTKGIRFPVKKMKRIYNRLDRRFSIKDLKNELDKSYGLTEAPKSTASLYLAEFKKLGWVSNGRYIKNGVPSRRKTFKKLRKDI